MKILITGSSGFVGKEVVKILKQHKHKIIEYDLDKEKNILNEKQLLEEMKNANAVIHLAGTIENTNPNLFKINVEGTKKVVEAAKKAKIKKLIFLSSTGVYGNTKGKINEKSLIKPENNYEKSKAEGEKIVLGIMDKVKVSIVRSAMIFGPNDYWKKMFKMLEKKYPLPCEGKNTFQIIYVKELANAICKVLEKGRNGEIYLAAGKEKETLNDFIKMIQKEKGLKQEIKHIPVWVGILLGKILRIKMLTLENIRHLNKERNYDTEKIYTTGYKQKISLKQAIREVVEKTKE
jgi:nucleoside-diphosphate-sugar epimerase